MSETPNQGPSHHAACFFHSSCRCGSHRLQATGISVDPTACFHMGHAILQTGRTSSIPSQGTSKTVAVGFTRSQVRTEGYSIEWQALASALWPRISHLRHNDTYCMYDTDSPSISSLGLIKCCVMLQHHGHTVKHHHRRSLQQDWQHFLSCQCWHLASSQPIVVCAAASVKLHGRTTSLSAHGLQ